MSKTKPSAGKEASSESVKATGQMKLIARSCDAVWASIESAPRDGTPVLAFGRGTDSFFRDTEEEMPECFTVIYWRQTFYDDYEPDSDGRYRKVQKPLGKGWRFGQLTWFTPTHWMPLPPSPSVLKRVEKV